MDVKDAVILRKSHREFVLNEISGKLQDDLVKLALENVGMNDFDIGSAILDSINLSGAVPQELQTLLNSLTLEEIPKAHNISSTRMYSLDTGQKEMLAIEIRKKFVSNMRQRREANENPKGVNITELFFEASTIFFEAAPHILVVTADMSHEIKQNRRAAMMLAPGESPRYNFAEMQFIHNAVTAITTLELLFTEEGIASCRINSGNLLIENLSQCCFPYDSLSEILIGLLAFGYPKTKEDG